MATTTAPRQTASQPRVLATYKCDEGTRQLVAQRIKGLVALSDTPSGDQGRVYLVERRLSSLAELDALVEDYLAKAAECGRCPLAPAAWEGD